MEALLAPAYKPAESGTKSSACQFKKFLVTKSEQFLNAGQLMSATQSSLRLRVTKPRARFGHTRQPCCESVVAGAKRRARGQSRLSSRIRRSTRLALTHARVAATPAAFVDNCRTASPRLPAGWDGKRRGIRRLFCRPSGTRFHLWLTYSGLTSWAILSRRSAAGVRWVLRGESTAGGRVKGSGRERPLHTGFAQPDQSARGPL